MMFYTSYDLWSHIFAHIHKKNYNQKKKTMRRCPFHMVIDYTIISHIMLDQWSPSDIKPIYLELEFVFIFCKSHNMLLNFNIYNIKDHLLIYVNIHLGACVPILYINCEGSQFSKYFFFDRDFDTVIYC